MIIQKKSEALSGLSMENSLLVDPMTTLYAFGTSTFRIVQSILSLSTKQQSKLLLGDRLKEICWLLEAELKIKPSSSGTLIQELRYEVKRLVHRFALSSGARTPKKL